MEIKSVRKEKIDYPKMNEINNKKLKTCIPNKWAKLGITPLIFGIIMKNKVLATTFNEILETSTAGILPVEGQVLAGDVAIVDAIPITTYINRGITLGTVLIFIISLIGLIITKIKINKDSENRKIKKLKNIFKILLIMSIVIFIGWQIIYTFL